MKKKVLFLFAALITISGFAQNFKLESSLGVSKQFIKANANENLKFDPGSAKDFFGLNAGYGLILAKTESDKQGFTHYKFYQSYNSIPIDKTMFIVHTKSGMLQSVSGTIITEPDPNLDKQRASVSAEKAVSLAVAKVGAKLYAWQDAGMQQRIKDQTSNAKASYYPKAQLVYYNPQELLMSRELRLCYKVDVYAVQPLSRADYFIDAQTGAVIGKHDKIQETDAVGTANTAYSGARSIHSDQVSANSYRLRDYTKGSGIITLHGESGSRGADYTSTSANWTLAGTNIAALDAHYGVSETYNYYMNSFGRSSYDGNGAALFSYVNDPTYLDNAFWDGSSMNFNKRSTGEPGGVTGIDVTGHELTHGVTQETCGLNYSFESGAMNESLSDIMGKSVQFTAKPNDVNWLMSNDMNWIIRDMSNPNAQGQPDTYKGNLWYTGSGDNGGVHYNSGVGNFMFYLLVNGGSGTNDKGSNYAVSGIGLAKADQIIYRSQTVYLTPTSQYADWRTACINGAADLYGSSSVEANAVKNAFYAVGIGTDSTGCEAPGGLSAISITTTSATLKWGASSPSTGYNLQWRVITSPTWKTVSNLTTNSYNLTGLKPGFSYQFKVQNKCTGTTTSSYSEAYTFTTLSSGPAYCTSNGSSTSYEYIQSVGMKGKAYVSGNNNGYANFISISIPLRGSRTDTLTLTPGFGSGSYAEGWSVFIDYNHDGDFADAGEMVGTAAASTAAVKVAFTVPASALNGTTRMRIIMAYSAPNTNPCGSYAYGETEDYGVKITGGTLNIAEKDDSEEATTLAVVPNPIKSNTANASFNLVKQGAVTIKVTDLSGRLLLSQDVRNAQVGKNNVVLNGLSKLNNGIFMMVAEQNGIIIGRSQIVISR